MPDGKTILPGNHKPSPELVSVLRDLANSLYSNPSEHVMFPPQNDSLLRLPSKVKAILQTELKCKLQDSQLSEDDKLAYVINATENYLVEHLLQFSFTPREEQWDGLARQLMLAFDLKILDSNALLKFLEDTGCRIPGWLNTLRGFGHLSKGTRVSMIYRAMIDPECGQSKFRIHGR